MYRVDITGHRHKRLAGLAFAIGLIAGLAGCTSAGNNAVDNTLDLSPQASNLPPVDARQDVRAFCPDTTIRAGTETFDVYPRGVTAEDPDAAAQLRWRATITETARECNSAGGGQFLNIRVGVRGRYLSGPKKETGSFLMPVRIAVVQVGDVVLYSKLHQIPGEVLPGKTNGVFSFVDEEVSIPMPDSRNVAIYVGFDEGPYDTP